MQTIDISAVAITEAPMTAEEAREAVKQINAGAIFIRGKLLEIHRRKGWEALGYESWKEFAEGEFQSHRDTLYKMVEAAETEIKLIESGAEVSKIFDTPDSQLRVIQQAGGADLRVKAFNLLQSWKEEGSGVTAKDAEAAVFTVDRNKRYNKAQKLVSDFIVANDDPENATVKDVLKWAEEKKGLTPRLSTVLEEDVKVFVNQGQSEKAQNEKVTAVTSNSTPSVPKKDKATETASVLANYSEQELANGLVAMGQEYWLDVFRILLPLLVVEEINESDLQGTADILYAAGEAVDALL